ncbi:MAG TPA: hypoxanthine phosphoribosyltransferase [Armatimonadota bacterium]|jgi:hypoxanthine phosphoribosyltransferase
MRVEPLPESLYCRDQLAGVLVTAEQIAARVAELGAQITRDYQGDRPLVLGVLKGSFMFLADLLRQIQLPCGLDFITVSTYGDEAISSHEMVVVEEPGAPLEGRRVLIVEDIVDTGHTLAWLADWVGRSAAEVRICTLLDKPDRRETPVHLDYVGFEVPDEFLVGYGLDYAQCYRNLPYVAVLKPEVYERPAES